MIILSIGFRVYLLNEADRSSEVCVGLCGQAAELAGYKTCSKWHVYLGELAGAVQTGNRTCTMGYNL